MDVYIKSKGSKDILNFVNEVVNRRILALFGCRNISPVISYRVSDLTITLPKYDKTLTAYLGSEKLVVFFRKILHTLADMHAHNITYLDLKPSNIMIARDGGLFFIDFETCCIHNTKAVSRGTHGICASGLTSSAADMWSLGAVILYILGVDIWDETNLRKGVLRRDVIEKFFQEFQREGTDSLLVDVAEALLQEDETKRPTAVQLLNKFYGEEYTPLILPPLPAIDISDESCDNITDLCQNLLGGWYLSQVEAILYARDNIPGVKENFEKYNLASILLTDILYQDGHNIKSMARKYPMKEAVDLALKLSADDVFLRHIIGM